MPLLVRQLTPAPPPGTPDGHDTIGLVGATWTGVDGDTWDLMAVGARSGVVILDDGVDGLGAVPRAVTRQDLALGGSLPRWSHAGERIITLPLLMFADDPATFRQIRRGLARSFTRTAPPAGVPRPGVLRITREDGTWRECSAIYLGGMDALPGSSSGATHGTAVVQLLACDPWWYGESTVAITFRAAEQRNYLAPYGTVSPDTTLGTETVEIVGEIPVSPVWTIVGPATSASVAVVGGPSWTVNGVSAGETITIDTARHTVTTQTGANAFARLTFPGSELFALEPGPNRLELTLTGGLPETSRIELTYRPRWETE